MYAAIISATGWTWEYIDECMTLPRLASMQQYWREHPPHGALLELIAAAHGWRPERKPKRITRAGLMALAAKFGGRQA